MENIALLTPSQEFQDFMEMQPGVAKNIVYYRQMMGRTTPEANICKKDGCVYYSYSEVGYKKSKNNYYLHRTRKAGFTLNEKGKLSIWFNKSIFEIPHINKVFEYYNFNWLTNYRLQHYITKGIFEKMLTGKITNSTDVIKEYFKKMRINGSPALFVKFLEKCDILVHQVEK